MQTITNLEMQLAKMSMAAPAKDNEQKLGSVIAARSAEWRAKSRTEYEPIETLGIIIPTFIIATAFAMALLWNEMILVAFGG